MTIESLIGDAKAEFREWYLNERPGRNATYDQISEIADSQVPIYTYDVYECLSDDHSLGEANEFGDFKDVEQLVQQNIFLRIEQALHEYLPELKDELYDIELEEAEDEDE